MSWQVRHQGSPRSVADVTLEQIADGLRDGVWEPTDEVTGPGESAWVAIENHPQLAELAAELEPAEMHRRVEATSLDMNALIDVCLVLLIFFILTTTYAAAVQKVVPLPTVQSQEGNTARTIKSEQLRHMIRLEAELDRGGKPVIRVNNQTRDVLAQDGTLDGERLAGLLRDERKRTESHEMILAAREVTWATVIAIQDAARSAGIQKVHHLLRK